MDNLFSLNTIAIIFVILFPGIIIRRAFYSDKFSKQFYRGQFSERLITTLFWGIINGLVSIAISVLVLKLFFLDSCLFCLLQGKIRTLLSFNIENQSIIVGAFSSKYILYVVLFLFNLFILPALLGRFAFVVIRRLRLDLKYSFLSFSNHWHYFFSGEILSKDSHTVNSDEFDFRKNRDYMPVVDVLTIEGDNKYLYKGILIDYNLKDQNEELDSLVLSMPLKKNYDKDVIDKEKQDYLEFQKIPGKIILIPYSTIINININFKRLTSPKVSVKLKESDTFIQNETQEPNKTDTQLGCFVIIVLIVLSILAANYSENISYFQFLAGLTFIFFSTGVVTAFIKKLIHKVSFATILWFLFTVLIIIVGFLVIFNIYTIRHFISF